MSPWLYAAALQNVVLRHIPQHSSFDRTKRRCFDCSTLPLPQFSCFHSTNSLPFRHTQSLDTGGGMKVRLKVALMMPERAGDAC
jgi:hypothetical protein